MFDMNELPATLDDIETYTQGACHIFALALHRHLGAELVVVTDPKRTMAAAPDGRRVARVLHVFATIGTLAYDVASEIRTRDVAGVSRLVCRARKVEVRHLRGEADLSAFIKRSPDDAERPLRSYTEDDIEKAWAVAMRVLPPALLVAKAA